MVIQDIKIIIYNWKHWKRIGIFQWPIPIVQKFDWKLPMHMTYWKIEIFQYFQNFQ